MVEQGERGARGAQAVEAMGDVNLLSQLVFTATTKRVVTDLAAAGFDDLRPSHGYVFQGLLAGDSTITQLAQRLGVSAQAVSKRVAELDAAGYLVRRPDGTDGRARSVEITARGRAMLAKVRESQDAVAEEIVAHLGARDAAELDRLLRSLLDLYGGVDVIADRRIRPSLGLI
jgi:DNA-binding MarR family transcriptional regulator